MPRQPQIRRPVKIPLRVMLIAPFITLVVVAVVLTNYISFQNEQRAINHVTEHLRNEQIARIEAHLSTFLETPHQINQINATVIRQQLLDINNPHALEHHFWEQVQIFDSVTSIYFGNPAGGIVSAGREGNLES